MVELMLRRAFSQASPYESMFQWVSGCLLLGDAPGGFVSASPADADSATTGSVWED